MKVKIVEVTVFVADDGSEFDSAEAMAAYRFKNYLNELIKNSNKEPVDYIVANWPTLNNARADIIKDVYFVAEKALQNHRNLYGVL